jgi:hypothetical protein
MLAGQVLHHLSHSLTFQVGFCAFAQDQPQTVILLPLSQASENTSMHPTPRLFFNIGSCYCYFFAQAGLELQSPYLHLLSSWRCEPPCPTLQLIFKATSMSKFPPAFSHLACPIALKKLFMLTVFESS